MSKIVSSVLNILQRRIQIEQQIAQAYTSLKALQEECAHPALVGIFRSDTGNWSRSDDVYWVEFKCPDCGKRWDENQSDTTLDRVRGNVSKDGFPFRRMGDAPGSI